jgi:hypothetical protein
VQNDVQSTAPLFWRALSFGEIFDRAVTLYVRNFVPFVSIALITGALQLCLQYTPGFVHANLSIVARLMYPRLASQFPLSAGTFLYLILEVVVPAAAAVFVANAVAVGVAEQYERRPVRWRECCAAALHVWRETLRLFGLSALVVLGWLIAAAFGATIVIGPTLAVFGQGIVSLVIVSLVGLVLIAVTALVSAMLRMAFYAVVFEKVAAGVALGNAYDRIFSGSDFWRALGVVVAAQTIPQLVLFAFGFYGQRLGMALGVTWPVKPLTTALDVVMIPFTVIVLTVFYFDIRIRREGLDLENAVGSMAPMVPVAE